jgi:hypothetical protein
MREQSLYRRGSISILKYLQYSVMGPVAVVVLIWLRLDWGLTNWAPQVPQLNNLFIFIIFLTPNICYPIYRKVSHSKDQYTVLKFLFDNSIFCYKLGSTVPLAWIIFMCLRLRYNCFVLYLL